MQDRVSLHPGRVKLVPVPGQENTYDMVRSDSPTQEGTPLNKDSLLKDATAALYGLGADAAPDDVLSMLYRVTNYAWKRRAAAYVEKRTAAPSNGRFDLAYGTNSVNCSQTVEYSAEIEINSTTGAISLKNPQTLTVPWTNGPTIAGVLKGKYVKNTFSSQDKIVFITASATITNNSTSSSYWVDVKSPSTNVFIISSEIVSTGDWSIVYAPDRNAYPDNGISNGYEYVFLGNPIDNAVSAPEPTEDEALNALLGVTEE